MRWGVRRFFDPISIGDTTKQFDERLALRKIGERRPGADQQRHGTADVGQTTQALFQQPAAFGIRNTFIVKARQEIEDQHGLLDREVPHLLEQSNHLVAGEGARHPDVPQRLHGVVRQAAQFAHQGQWVGAVAAI